MNRLLHIKKPGFIWLLMITVLVMSGMLYFGFRLKDVEPGNNVQWSDSGKGLVFNRSAMAYTDDFFADTPGASAAGLTIEMAIQPKYFDHSNFSFILLVHGGRDERQLVIGQYRSSLMIMNGNDYSNKRRIPKIYVQLDEKIRVPRFITIISNEAGTRVFVDGTLIKTKDDLRLRYPIGGSNTKIVLGNSVDGNHPWMGVFMGLALYDQDLGAEIVRKHYIQWRLDNSFKAFTGVASRLMYTFDEGHGKKVYNHVSNNLDLVIPEEVIILTRKVLSWPHFVGVARTSMVADVFLNLTGFIPLGFLWMSLLTRFERFEGKAGQLTAVLITFFFSLLIEIAQAWIPTRDSSLLDLVLNTSGGWTGVLTFKWISKRMGW